MSQFRHLTRTDSLDREWIETELFPLCEHFRTTQDAKPVLGGRALYCLFYEPSFLTRTSFERAMGLLGGQAYHTEDASQFFPVTNPSYVDSVINNLVSLRVDLVVLRVGDGQVVAQAEAADVLPVINGGSDDDHPTQALADLYTIHREHGTVDGTHVAVIGRVEHRNVTALLKGLSMFNNIKVTLLPFSGQVDPDIEARCKSAGMDIETVSELEDLSDADVIYLNGPRTEAHLKLLRSRDSFNLRIDSEFMANLKDNCIIMDPMQRSGDFVIDVQDKRLGYYRQAENGLFVRMAVLAQTLGN